LVENFGVKYGIVSFNLGPRGAAAAAAAAAPAPAGPDDGGAASSEPRMSAEHRKLSTKRANFTGLVLGCQTVFANAFFAKNMHFSLRKCIVGVHILHILHRLPRIGHADERISGKQFEMIRL